MSTATVTESRTDLFMGTMKITLGFLNSLSGVIPHPAVAAAISAATKVFEIAEAVRSNAADVNMLKNRVHDIMLAVVSCVMGKTEDKLAPDMVENIKSLSSDLESVSQDLERMHPSGTQHSMQKKIKAVILYSDNARTIQDCSSRLEWAVTFFNVRGHIHDSLRISQISRDLAEGRQADAQVLQSLELLNSHISKVEGAVQGIASEKQTQEAPAVLPSFVIPAKPQIFYGRDTFVDDLVSRIRDGSGPRLAILGPGGMGKTSVALTVLKHPDVVRDFGSRRHWASCEVATNEELFLEIVARSLKLTKPSNDRRDDIVTFLDEDTQPRILVLDNFETPCDIPAQLSKIIDILADLFERSHLTIIVTMRGESLPGADRLDWSTPSLPILGGLPGQAARNLYNKISKQTNDDVELDALLSALDHMPLAVTLMAKVAQGGDTPAELLERWKADGVDIVDEDKMDRRRSLSKSIEMSLRSNSMTQDPDALRVLSVVAFLPAGVRMKVFSDLVPTITCPLKARGTLLNASLIYMRSERRSYHVLSPIRSYVLCKHPLTPELWDSLCDFYVDYVARHASGPGDPTYAADLEALALEDINLVAVLLYALERRPCPAIVDAAIQFSYYQYRTAPRVEVVMATVDACRRHGFQNHLGISLKLLGNINITLERYSDGRAALIEASTLFRFKGDSFGLAWSQRQLGFIDFQEGRHDEARAALQIARDEFRKVESHYGEAACLVRLAGVDVQQGRYNDARESLQKAHRIYSSFGDTYGEASCQERYATIDLRQGRYANAHALFQQVEDNFNQLRLTDKAARARIKIAWSFRIQGQYDAAHEIYTALMQHFKRRKDASGVAECKKDLGRIAAYVGRFEDARVLLCEARQVFVELGQPRDIAECVQNIGDSERLAGCYKDAVEALQQAYDEFRRLGMPFEMAECLESLADIDLNEGRIEEAGVKVSLALALWRELDKADSIVLCEGRLAEITTMREVAFPFPMIPETNAMEAIRLWGTPGPFLL